MLENLIDNFRSYLINNHTEISLVTHEPLRKILEIITDSFVCNESGIDCLPSSVFNSDCGLSEECAKISLNDASTSDNCTEPSDPNDICDISKQRILASNSDEISKRETRKILNSEEFTESGRHLPAESSDHFVDLEHVIQTCETKWHSFFKEVKTVKESSLENFTLNQGKDRKWNSVETTGMKRQEKTENQEMQHHESYSRVIEASKTQWPSLLKEDKTVKVPAFKNFTFNQAKDRMSNSVQTTGIKLKGISGNKKIHEVERYPSMEHEQRGVYANSALKNLSISGNCPSSKKFQVSHSCTISSSSYSSHSDTISCEQIKGKSNSVNSSSVNNFTVSKLPHSGSTYTVEAGLSNSSHFPFSNKSNHAQISERFLGHSVKLCGDSTGKLLDPRLNPNRKRKIINDRREIVLKRVKWASGPAVLSKLKSSNEIRSHPKTCVVHSNGSAINSKISDPRLKHSKIFSKHSVPSFHETKVSSSKDSVTNSPTLSPPSKIFSKHSVPSFHETKVSSSKDSVTNSPTLSPPRIHNRQHISSDVASNSNLLSNSLPNISPSTYPFKKRKGLSLPTSPLGRRDISSSTFPLERRDISSSTSETLKTKLTPNSMDDHSWTLPLKKRKVPYDVISSMECGKNSSPNKINILDTYSNCESISKSQDEAISTIEVGDKVDTVKKSLDEISAFISSIRNQTNKEESTSSCATSKIMGRNRITGSSSCQDQISAFVSSIRNQTNKEESISSCAKTNKEESISSCAKTNKEESISSCAKTNKEESISSCATSKVVRRNQNTESSSRQDQTSDSVTIDTSKKDLDCTSDCMMKPTENSLLCGRWNSNVEEQHSLPNDAFFRNRCNLPVRSTPVNVSTCSRYSSINVNSKENCFSLEISSDVKRLHSVSPHASHNKSIGINKVSCNLKEYGAISCSQLKLWREKYLKSKAKRQANKLVIRMDSFCDKTSSRSKQSDPNSHDSSDISQVQSSEMQTMNSLVPLGNYFDKEGILKIVHVCSHVEIGERAIISVKVPLKLVSKLCWKYYLNSFSMRLNRLISKEKLTSNPSSVNILKRLLKYPFAKHLIRHSNNGLNGDLKYLLLQTFKEHCLVSFAIAHEDTRITSEQNDETLSVNPSYVKSSIKPMDLVVDCNALQNIPSEWNGTEYVRLNSHTALPEASSSDGTISCYDSGMFNETDSINNTPLEDMKIQIQQNYEAASENTSDVNSNNAILNSVVDCNALQNMPSESNNSAHVCLNSHTFSPETFSSDVSTLCYDSDMLDETEESKRNYAYVEDINIPTLQHNEIESETTNGVKSCIAPINSVADCNALQNISSELKSADNVCLNSHTYSPEIISSDDSTLCYDSDMLDEIEETERNDMQVEDIKIPTLQNNKIESETTRDVKSYIASINSIADCDVLQNISSELKSTDNVCLNSHTVSTKVISSDDSNLCYDFEMLDETEEIESNKISSQVSLNSHPVLPEASSNNSSSCFDSEILDETEEIESNKISSQVSLNSHPVLPEASSNNSSSCFDNEILDETEEIERNKNTMHDEDIKIAAQQNDEMTVSENTTDVISDIVSIKSEELECTADWNSHPVLPGASSADDSSLCYDSEKLDETEEKPESSNISSTFWLTLNSMWNDFFQFTEVQSYLGSESYKSIVKLLRKKGISFPILEHFEFLNYENKFISERYRNSPVNYYGTVFTCRKFDIRQGDCFLSRSCERLKAKYLCFKYFSTKMSDVLIPMPANVEEYGTFYFVKTIENNFISLSPPQIPCSKQSKKLIPFNVDPEQDKKPIPYKVDSEHNEPISCTVYREPDQKPAPYKVDTEKIKLYLQQNKKPNHRKVRPVSLKEINEVCNGIKAMEITVSSDTTTEKNSDILDSSCTDVKYQKCTDKIPQCPKLIKFPKRPPSKNGSELEILRVKQLPDTSPGIFYSNCHFNNERICYSSGIDELFEDLDLFKEGGVLDRYYKHLKGCGEHTINVHLIKKNKNDLRGIECEVYRILEDALNYHKCLLRGLVHLASGSAINHMRLYSEIVVQTDFITGSIKFPDFSPISRFRLHPEKVVVAICEMAGAASTVRIRKPRLRLLDEFTPLRGDKQQEKRFSGVL
ncbi:hypothetical protein AVEN_198227-1 [Araneus ventricosus]|uniref:Uncharacterized protein n=1 Tax=Araneus ventricosus TaxID=182803 RepID=A0A4Y2JJI4_ARAVE|nr:hypothetical protein AVEN_198227-1 [Araneus ventricosus]